MPPAVASQGPNANEQPQEDISSSSGPKMCGPVVLDEDMLSKLGSQKAGMDVRAAMLGLPGTRRVRPVEPASFFRKSDIPGVFGFGWAT